MQNMALTKNPIPDLGYGGCPKTSLSRTTRVLRNGSEAFRKLFRTPEAPHTWAQHIWKEEKEKKINENSLFEPVCTLHESAPEKV